MKLKRLERAWKSLFFAAATKALGRGGQSPRTRIPGDRPLRILVLRQDRVGDAVITTGLLRALKSANRDNVVDVLASPANAPILQRDPNVSTVHIYNKRNRSSFPDLYRALRHGSYDVAIDCMITAPSMTGLLLMLVSGAPHRIGVAGRGVDEALTHPVPLPVGRTHIIDLMAPLASPLRADSGEVDMSPALEVPPPERERARAAWEGIGDPQAIRLLVNVSAGKPEREWPLERFVAVIEDALSRSSSVAAAVVGAPLDRVRTQEIARASGATLVDTPRLSDLIAMVATADCVLTPDTSVTHIAAALRVPAVILFQHQEVADQWGLYRSPGENVVGGVDSLIDLPVAPVVAAVRRLLDDCEQRAKRSGEAEPTTM